MNRPGERAGRERRTAVHGLAEGVQEAAENGLADWNADRRAERDGVGTAGEARGDAQRHGAYGRRTEMLVNFRDQRTAAIRANFYFFADRRQRAGRKFDVENGTANGKDLSQGGSASVSLSLVHLRRSRRTDGEPMQLALS